jgi:hypothetical protein
MTSHSCIFNLTSQSQKSDVEQWSVFRNSHYVLISHRLGVCLAEVRYRRLDSVSGVVKFVPVETKKARRRVDWQLLLSLTPALDGSEWFASLPGSFF